jgi:hypothetical protein
VLGERIVSMERLPFTIGCRKPTTFVWAAAKSRESEIAVEAEVRPARQGVVTARLSTASRPANELRPGDRIRPGRRRRCLLFLAGDETA